MRPLISVIVPARNEALSIHRCLDSILASDYPSTSMEVIVADGLSTDGTRGVLDQIAARDPRLRMIDNPARITPAALNRAIEAAHGDLILRIDAHSVISSTYLSELVRFLESDPDVWGAGGRMYTVPETEGVFAKPISIVLRHKFGVGNSEFRTNTRELNPRAVDTVFNCCWRRWVFDRVGLFHEQLERSQDIEMSSRITRAGGSLWLVPQAETTYFARTYFGKYLRHNWSNGVWSLMPAIFLGRLPVRWRHLVPLVFVTALASTILLAAARIAPLWLPLVPAIPYVLLNLAASFSMAWKERDLRLAVLLPLAFAGLHLGYGAGSLWGALRVAAHAARTSLRTLHPAPTHSSTPL